MCSMNKEKRLQIFASNFFLIKTREILLYTYLLILVELILFAISESTSDARKRKPNAGK